MSSKSPDEWVFVSEWDESVWEDKKEFLTLEDLDSISPVNPAYAKREDGHLIVVNTLALKKLPIDFSHPGVEKDDDGNPTGILKDVWLDLTPYYKHLIPDSIKASCNIAASQGITSVVDNLTIVPEGQKNILESYHQLDESGELPIRIFLNPTRELIKEYVEQGINRNSGSDKLKYSGYKGFFDGALGAQTALLSFNYLDAEGKGVIFLDEDELISQVIFAEKHDCTLCIHAIGDQAIDRLLNCFEEGISRAGKTTTTNLHRIEHAEMITDKQVSRAFKLGIVLSMQPNFLKWQYPGELYEQRLGKDKYLTLNRFKSILNLGAHLSFGSDNMPLSPLFGIHQAVNFPSDVIRLSVEEAIMAYTYNNAISLSMGNNIGNISEGNFADFLILDKSPFQIKPSSIDQLVIQETYVGGKSVYQKKI